MHSREAIAALVPHQGLMCLWQEVTHWDHKRITLRSHGHLDAAHPLRAHGRLHAVHLCEYGAQAMAVHGGLLGQASGAAVRPGVLVALRNVVLHVDTLDELHGPLQGRAEVLIHGQDSQQYAFRIHHADTLLAEGRASVVLGA
jgi:predicted hotdog family 3-hydroxylacyl-ACP dehydratase